MAWFKIYAGLGGGFGGSDYCGTYEFDNEDQALDAAREEAIEIYESYEGNYGLLNWDECKETCIESGWGDNDDIVDEYYQEEIESWIVYEVEPTDGPDEDEL